MNLPKHHQTLAPVNEKISWINRHQQLTQLTAWELKGAMAVKAENTGGQARMDWQQHDANTFRLVLTGPVGSGRAEIIGQSAHVVLTQSDGQVFEAPSAQALLLSRLGWDVPVAYLYYWMRGIPSPDLTADVQFDEFNHLTRLTQAGWTIHYDRYTRLGGLDVPAKLTATRDNVRVKFVIQQWRKA